MNNNKVTRMAVLLYNSEDGLKGAERDIDMYVRFLLSSRGGSWRKSEIALWDVCKWSPLEFKSNLIHAAPDYLMMVYAGHGCILNGRTCFPMRNGELCAVESLNSLADKQLTIADCCRVPGKSLMLESEMTKLASFGSTGDTSAIFCKAVAEADPQHITMYACSPGEAASDGASYSLAMLSRLRKANPDGKRNVITAVEAHVLAHSELLTRGIKQIPRVTTTVQHVSRRLPLAVV